LSGAHIAGGWMQRDALRGVARAKRKGQESQKPQAHRGIVASQRSALQRAAARVRTGRTWSGPSG
jgi:hypothetical protein